MRYDNNEEIEGLMFTAVECAYAVAKSGFPYTKEMWDSIVAVLDPEIDKEARKYNPQRGVAPRSEVIVNALKKSGIKQVVEFAAGWTTHGLMLCKQDPNFKYIEVLYKNKKLGIDEAEEKRQVLGHMAPSVGGIPENYHILGGDALDEATFEEAAALLDPRQPAAVANVGLMGYFTDEQKLQYAMQVKTLLQEFGGKWITQDFTVPRKLSPKLSERLIKKTGACNPFTSKREVSKLLADAGLSRSFLLDEKTLKALTLDTKLVNCNIAERMLKTSSYSDIDVPKKGGREESL